jgi:histidinol phosphatase-like PHP family hydrolase
LDFLAIAEHLHIAKPFSEFYNVKKKVAQWARAGSNSKIQDLARKALELSSAGMQVNQGVAILAHPWHFFLSRGIYNPILLDLTPRLCEVAQDRGVAIEMPASHLQILSDKEKNRPFWDFIRSFWREVSRHDVRISVGSDAHRLEDIGHFENLETALNEFGLSPRRLLMFDDIPSKSIMAGK